MRLAPNMSEPHEAIGVIRVSGDFDWKGAEASFARALELAPGNVRVIRDAVDLLRALDRSDEAIALLRQAVEVDPLNWSVYRELSKCHLTAGRFDEAEAAIRRALELCPDARSLLFRLSEICLCQGRLEEALEAAKRVIHDGFRLLALAMIYHAQGRHAESDTALGELIESRADTAAFQIAEAFAYRGDRDQAFAWLERAYAQRDAGMHLLRETPSMCVLHADPRWQAFLEKVGLAG
jgi:tetratricopeptide (TPR) repeat protein